MLDQLALGLGCHEAYVARIFSGALFNFTRSALAAASPVAGGGWDIPVVHGITCVFSQVVFLVFSRAKVVDANDSKTLNVLC